MTLNILSEFIITKRRGNQEIDNAETCAVLNTTEKTKAINNTEDNMEL